MLGVVVLHGFLKVTEKVGVFIAFIFPMPVNHNFKLPSINAKNLN